LLFGIYYLVDGILGVWIAIAGRMEHEHCDVLLLWGLIGIGVGILTLLVPGVTHLIFTFYVAIWAIATGVLEIVAAIYYRRPRIGRVRRPHHSEVFLHSVDCAICRYLRRYSRDFGIQGSHLR
jgi:uncharacterized membrane protein HdeD (DUF308 family)